MKDFVMIAVTLAVIALGYLVMKKIDYLIRGQISMRNKHRRQCRVRQDVGEGVCVTDTRNRIAVDLEMVKRVGTCCNGECRAAAGRHHRSGPAQ